MRYVVFTFAGEGCPVAMHLAAEGQEVIVAQIEDKKDTATHVEEPRTEKPEEKKRRLATHDGFIKKTTTEEAVKELKAAPDKGDVFLYFDFNHDFKYAEQLRGLGFKGNFPTEEDRLLEVERDKAKEFVTEHYSGLESPETHEFSTAQEGLDFLADQSECFVLKGKDIDAKTVVPDTVDPELCAQEIEEALDQDKTAYEKSGFILEKKIYDPIELTPEIQFYDGVPLMITLDLEDKQLGAGNVGEMTGCAMDAVFQIPLDCELAKIAFPPVVYEMAKEHEGWFIWDASVLIDPEDDAMYFGEFCSNRLGYNCFYTELAMAPSVHEYFEAVADGRNPLEGGRGEFATSVRCFNLPNEYDGVREGLKASWDPGIDEDLWLMDVRKEGKTAATTGYSKDFAVVTGVGGSIKGAFRDAYRNVQKVSLVDMYYRYDGMNTDYPVGKRNTAILNRYNYAIEKGLI